MVSTETMDNVKLQYLKHLLINNHVPFDEYRVSPKNNYVLIIYYVNKFITDTITLGKHNNIYHAIFLPIWNELDDSSHLIVKFNKSPLKAILRILPLIRHYNQQKTKKVTK